MADFLNRLISRIFGVSSSGFFAQNNSNVVVRLLFACFLAILSFQPNGLFSKG